MDVPAHYHGYILKEYITHEGINKRGGINNLAKKLGLTRQGVYVLYKQEVIKEEHRKIIIDHFELANDFFPEVIELEGYYNMFFNEYVRLKKENAELKKELDKGQARYSTRLYLDDLYKETKNTKEGNIPVVMYISFNSYTNHYFDPLFLDRLPRLKIDNTSSGLAFQINDFSLTSKGYTLGTIVLATNLIEFYEDIKSDKPYIIVYKECPDKSHIICRYISYQKNKFRLYATDNGFKTIDIDKSNIEQIWEVSEIVNVSEEQYSELLDVSFLNESR